MKAGDKIPSLSKEVSQDMINFYAEVSGDFNPLHVDTEFARKSRFRGTIAHGHIAASWLCEMLTRWQGAAFLHGGKLSDVRFISPIRPGDMIEVTGEITDITQERVMCQVWVENQKGERCIAGKASIPLSVKMR